MIEYFFLVTPKCKLKDYFKGYFCKESESLNRDIGDEPIDISVPDVLSREMKPAEGVDFRYVFSG
jgi:hypothetical protein